MQVATTRMGRTRAVSMQKINVLLFRLEQVLSIDYTYSDWTLPDTNTRFTNNVISNWVFKYSGINRKEFQSCRFER